jgi:hypothetical protein
LIIVILNALDSTVQLHFQHYYIVAKEKLHKHLPISKAVLTIVEQTADLGRWYNAKINHDRKSLPQLLNRKAFAIAGNKLTAYALDKALRKWSKTKKMADAIEFYKLHKNNYIMPFKPGTECKLGCELPLRFGLQCKHWLYKAY